MAMGGADVNLGIDSEIGVDAESRCRNSKWTKNLGSGIAVKSWCKSNESISQNIQIFKKREIKF